MEGVGLLPRTPGGMPRSESLHQVPAHGDRHDSGHTVGQGCLFPRLGPGPHWVMAAFTACYYLDVLAKEAGMEAEPVGGDVEPTLEKEVPLEGTGTHWEDTGKNTAAARPTRRPQGLGLMLSRPQSPASGPVPSESPPQSQAPNSPFPQLPDSLFLRAWLPHPPDYWTLHLCSPLPQRVQAGF